jgi:4-hydroxy-tetrahydrodipicolinate reductase
MIFAFYLRRDFSMDIIINGILGRMGGMVAETAAEDAGIHVVGGFDAVLPETPFLFRGAEIPVCVNDADNAVTCAVAADVLVDFSHYTAVPALLDYAVSRGLPVVVATTALGEAERGKLRDAARSVAVFNSSNMSLGVNILKKMAQLAVPSVENDFNVEIVEAHHNRKKDSPSGTAIMLADAINDVCEVRKDYVFGRHGKSDDVKISDIGIHAVRGGTLPGRHTILFAGPDETIEITHTAYSRRIFALGALKAARYIIGKPAGLFTMDDLIG